MSLFSYRAMIRNIHLNKINPNLKNLKKFIEDYKFGSDERPTTQRKYSFEDIGAIISAKNRYSI